MNWTRNALVAAAAVSCAATAALFAEEKPSAESSPNAKRLSRAQLEERFSKQLTGAVLVGSFIVDGRDPSQPAEPERYEIVNASKLPKSDDYWVILARLQYGDKKLSLPIPITLKVAWAGDTPVMSLSDLTVPGFGTFTARVMFYGDRYAGTWQHGDVGGHMWGRIEDQRANRPNKDDVQKEQP
jgi:subtilisin family serine protease